MNNIELSSKKYKAYITIQYGISVFLYITVLFGVLWFVFFQDLSFDLEFKEFIEREKYSILVYLLLFTIFIILFSKVINNLVDIYMTSSEELKINGKIYGKSEVELRGEFVIFNFSFGLILLKGQKKYFIPKSSASTAPIMFYKTPKNESIRILMNFLK